MAFNIKKRTAAPDDGGTIITPQKVDGTVVATQSWVKRMLDKIWEWTGQFTTGGLTVTGPASIGSVRTPDLQAGQITTEKITILDENGNPFIMSIVDGKLELKYDFPSVYMYPGKGEVDIRSFFYRPDISIFDHFTGISPVFLLDRFVPLTGTDVVKYNDVNCYKICSADGQDIIMSKTLLITCDRTKVITGVCICDEQMRPIKRVSVGGNNVKMLTINMPVLSSGSSQIDETSYIQLPLPCSCDCCESHNPNIFPPRPIFNHPSSSLPLNPSIFDDSDEDIFDKPLCECGGEFDSPIVHGDVVETTEQVTYENYSTPTYTNIVLKNSDFKTNQKQFLVVETETISA